MLRVGLVVYEYVGENNDKLRILEDEQFKVNELDLGLLPIIALELGEKVLQGMLLETLGRRRSESVKPDK